MGDAPKTYAGKIQRTIHCSILRFVSKQHSKYIQEHTMLEYKIVTGRFPETLGRIIIMWAEIFGKTSFRLRDYVRHRKMGDAQNIPGRNHLHTLRSISLHMLGYKMSDAQVKFKNHSSSSSYITLHM